MLQPIPVLNDNYVWLYQRENTPAILVDMGDFTPVKKVLEEKNILPEALFLTHAHQDHTGGVEAFKKAYPDVPVYGAADCLPLATDFVAGGDIFTPNYKIHAIRTPGHTENDVCYLVDDILFTGDTLFSAGCGRVFTKDYEAMFESLQKILALPSETQICPAHEYTLSNLRFAEAKCTDPQRKQTISANLGIATFLTESKTPTVPTTLFMELAINPFLQAKTVAEFKQLRLEKDNF